MPMFETDSPVIIGIRDQLATKVNLYREGFAAREVAKPGTVSLQRALSIPLEAGETVTMDELLDPLFGYEFPDDPKRVAVVFAHLSERLSQLSEHFKEQASLFMSDLSDTTLSALSDEELRKLKNDCNTLFQNIIDLCGSPEAAGQPFTIKANNKGNTLKLPGFRIKTDASDKLSLYMGDSPDKLFIFNEERAEPYINRAVSEAFSMKASIFLKSVPFKEMDSPVEFINPNNGKTVWVQWVKEED